MACGDQRRRRSSTINTTMVEISPAAMTSWPIGLDRPMGSICAVCRKCRSAPRSAHRCQVAVEPWVRWAVRTLGRKFATSALGRVVSVRLTEFRGLMQLQFGSTRAPSVARDHVFSALGGLTADEALAAGEDPKTVWAAVCDAFDVSDTLRYGLPD